MFKCALNTLGPNYVNNMVGGFIVYICKYILGSLVIVHNNNNNKKQKEEKFVNSFEVSKSLNGNNGEWTNSDDVNQQDFVWSTVTKVVSDIPYEHRGYILGVRRGGFRRLLVIHSFLRFGGIHPLIRDRDYMQYINCIVVQRTVHQWVREYSVWVIRSIQDIIRHFRSQLNGSNGEHTNSDDVYPKNIQKNAAYLASKVDYWDMMTPKQQKERIANFCRVLSAQQMGAPLQMTAQERTAYLHRATCYFVDNDNINPTPAEVLAHAQKLFEDELYENTYGVRDDNVFKPLQPVPPKTHPVHCEVFTPLHPVAAPPPPIADPRPQAAPPPVPPPAPAENGAPVLPLLPNNEGFAEEKQQEVDKKVKIDPTFKKLLEDQLLGTTAKEVLKRKHKSKKHPSKPVEKVTISPKMSRKLQNSILKYCLLPSAADSPYRDLLNRCGKRVNHDFYTHVPMVDVAKLPDGEPTVYDRILVSDPVYDPHEKDGQKWSLVTDKYAYNTFGLFRIVNGAWTSISYKGGNCETFDSLKIKPILAASITENLLFESNKNVENSNIFFKEGNSKRTVLNPIEVIDDFVVGAVGYKYFVKFRKTLDWLLHESAVYNGYTKERRRIYVLRPLLQLLKRRYANATNELVYNNMFGIAVENCESVDIAIDTCLYFFESKLLAQAKASATVSAHMEYSKTKLLYRPPMSGVSVDPFKKDFQPEEGALSITSRDECRAQHRSGITVVQRELYKSCSDAYGSYDNPNREPGNMLEPISDRESKRMMASGVFFKDPYIKFQYEENDAPECYQSVGGGFMTAVAVINHKSTRQCEMAHSRILFARDDELEQRYRATRFWDEVLNVFKSLATHQKGKKFELQYSTELRRLESLIRQRDPKYCGGDQIYVDWERAGNTHSELPMEIQMQAHVQAYLHYTMANVQILHEELRRFDDVAALNNYIEEVGAKLPLRRDLLRKLKECVLKGVQNKVNVVQCKPHEFQKYKMVDGKPVLKYARDVVSITDEDWLAAKPHLMAYVKKMLDSEFEIRKQSNNDCTDIVISYSGEGMNNWVHDTYTLPEHLHLWARRHHDEFLRGPVRYRSIISDTSLDMLSQKLTEAHQFVADNEHSVYIVTHGDDQLVLVNNTSPHRFGGKIGVVYVEADINDNDGSHVDPFYRLDHATFVVRGGEVPTEAFAQLANPLMLANPNDIKQYAILRRRHGMQMCSGSVHTTYGNSKMSMNVGLCLAFDYTTDDYSFLARKVGMNVTALYGGLTDVTFLSKNFYRDEFGEIRAYTDLASLLRKIGRVTGDVNGRSKTPVDIRFDEHNKQVVQSWVHEPDSLIVQMMRARYIEESPVYNPNFGYRIQTNFRTYTKFSSKKLLSEELTSIDVGIIHHYYPGDFLRGEQEYRNLLTHVQRADTYGEVIKSPFIDAIMKRRYGMVGVTV